MDPYSQQPNQSYAPQQGQYPNPPQPASPYNPAAYSNYQQGQPQTAQVPPMQPSYSQPQVYQPQVFYPQGQPAYQGRQYPQTTAYNPYGQYAAQDYSSVNTGKFPFSLKSKAAIGAAGFVVLVAGIFGISKLSADTPADLFYTALDNQLKLSSVHVVQSSVAPKLNSTTKVNYYVNLEDPASPKAAGTVESAFAFLRTKTEVAADFNADRSDVYVRFTKPPFDNWIVTTEGDQQLLSSTKAANLNRIRDMALGANSIFGVILSGDFSKDLRSSTMKSIKDRSAYEVVSNEPASDAGASVRKYTVKLNREVLRGVQESAADKLGIEFQDLSDSDKEYSFFIDTKRKYVTKIEQVDGDTTYSVTYSEQNEAFEASLPAASVTADQYLSTLK